MVVAVAVMRMMQVAVDQIVRMIAMRNGFVSAVCAMKVLRIVAGAGVTVGAGIRIRGAHLHRVLVDVAGMLMMQVAIVQKVGMAVVLDLGVTAVGTVLVRMVFVNNVGGAHIFCSFQDATGADGTSGFGVDWKGCSEA